MDTTERNVVNPTWFGLALQALVILSDSDHVCTSASIADDTNAGVTFMRRIMAPLVKANIVEAREGRDGGYLLAKPANHITLAEVFAALQVENPLSAALLNSVDTDFPHAEGVNRLFSEIAEKADARILEVLESYTVADLITGAK